MPSVAYIFFKDVFVLWKVLAFVKDVIVVDDFLVFYCRNNGITHTQKVLC